MNTPSTPLNPEPTNKGRGCLLAIAIVGGLFALATLSVGALAYRYANSKDGKKVVSTVASGVVATYQGMHAPGTDALRALGCDQAMVMPMNETVAIGSLFTDAGPSAASLADYVNILCSVRSRDPNPTCDQVAATYTSAADRPKAKFMVVVTSSALSGNNTLCAEWYSPDGTRLPRRHDTRP